MKKRGPMPKPDSLLITDEAVLLLNFGDCKILINMEENHYKFWTYRQDPTEPNKVTFYWGRIGKVVQELEKDFGSKWAASGEIDSKVREKIKKGYRPIEE